MKKEFKALKPKGYFIKSRAQRQARSSAAHGCANVMRGRTPEA